MMKQVIKFILVVCCGLFAVHAFAWSAAGHRIIAQIAYEHLTPKVKQQVNRQIEILEEVYPRSSTFVSAAVWADAIKGDGIRAFNSWHYINIPYRVGKVRAYPPAKENVVWAILQSEKVIASPTANAFEQGLFLRFLIHFVGDAHQPMHCISRFSRHYPHGDAGGNWYPIRARDASNLHEFWDEGLGLFSQYAKGQPFTAAKVRALADNIQHAYPESYFAGKTEDLQPQDWANESYQIGKRVAYQLPRRGRPTAEYIANGQKIVQQRLALAGYRLANLLNQLYGKRERSAWSGRVNRP